MSPESTPRSHRRWRVSWLLVLLLILGTVGESHGDEPSAGHQRMLDTLERIRREAPDRHIYQGDAVARVLRDRLAALPPNASPIDRLSILLNLGVAELAIGNERESIDRLGEAYVHLPALLVRGLPREAANNVAYNLGVAHMRYGETQNCCLRNSPESCILPIEGAGVHTKPEGSREAIRYLTEVVENSESESGLHLKAQWLLNIAYMTLGEYPDDVPEAHRIPPAVFDSDADFPRFVNVASRLGVDTFSLSGGAVCDDMDGDEDLDLLVSTWDVSGQIRYFRNDGDGSFSDRTEEANLTGLLGGLNLVHADYDNDGDVDVFVLRGAWLFQAGRHPNSLLRNDGNGRFDDVTFEAGLGREHYPTQTGAWADYDNDGDLDLYVGNESTPKLAAPGQLFRNNGDGTFTDVAAAAGVTNMSFAKAVSWGDYDGDRDPDLFVSNLSGANRLYRNEGDGTFVDVASSVGVTEPFASFPAWFWDVDNDGNLDLFVSSYAASIEHIAGAYLGLAVERGRQARLYRGIGVGRFEEVGREWGLERPTSPMGANFGDIDGDGLLDFYLGTGDPQIENIMPNTMYRNSGRGFSDITTAGGFGHLQKGHAVVFADLDNDGDQDLFEQMGGAYLGDRYNDALFENPGFGHRWLSVRLVGTTSNRSAIGARIRVDVTGPDGERAIYRYVNSGGSFGGNPFRQTIGLGNAAGTVRVEVYWPTSDTRQVFEGVSVDRAIEIREGSDAPVPLPLRRFRLGSK
jgi:hypothetical protein